MVSSVAEEVVPLPVALVLFELALVVSIRQQDSPFTVLKTFLPVTLVEVAALNRYQVAKTVPLA